ncbi:22265_t:CDS:2 [Rhizophagus irregularis]|nr:22265_t:CDS:2 [Rhizophagus irregularis]
MSRNDNQSSSNFSKLGAFLEGGTLDSSLNDSNSSNQTRTPLLSVILSSITSTGSGTGSEPTISHAKSFRAVLNRNANSPNDS